MGREALAAGISVHLQASVAESRLCNGEQLHDRVRFDVAHQLTYVGFRVPGLLWKLDTPFVWGPIGGLEQTTWALLPALGVRGALYFVARNLLNAWTNRFRVSPGAPSQKQTEESSPPLPESRKKSVASMAAPQPSSVKSGFPQLPGGSPSRGIRPNPLP